MQQTDDLVGVAMPAASPTVTWRTWLRHLYKGSSPTAYRFRYGLLAFDIVTIVFVMMTSFLPRSRAIEVIDVAIGLVLLTDMAARFIISKNRLRHLLHPTGALRT